MREFAAWCAIARVGFREIARDKVFYTSLFAAVLLLCLGLLASRLSFLTQERVMRDFGLSALRVANAAVAILFASSLLAREIERRTVFVALARPLSRAGFVYGKFLGLAGVLVLNGALLALTYFALLALAGGGIEAGTAAAALLAVVECLVLGALALFLSTFTTPTLTVLFSCGFWLIGSMTSELRSLATRLEPGWLSSSLHAGTRVFPDFELFHLGFRVTYGLPIASREVLGGVGYGLLLCVTFLLLAGVGFRRKEI